MFRVEFFIYSLASFTKYSIFYIKTCHFFNLYKVSFISIAKQLIIKFSTSSIKVSCTKQYYVELLTVESHEHKILVISYMCQISSRV